MISIKDGSLDKLKDFNITNMHILADFDRTMTIGSSESSWGILSKSPLVPNEYVNDRKLLYNYYRPLEVDETIDYKTKNQLMTDWWQKHIQLFIKYKLQEDVINQAIKDPNVMTFRKGAKDFLELMHKNSIPVIIISAGIGNFIEQFLINNDAYFDNIYIVSNFIKFENGIAVGIKDTIIHSLNKNEAAIPNYIRDVIKDRDNIILFGDFIGDVLMAPDEKRDHALKIGFLEENILNNTEIYKKTFDIVCTDNTSFKEVLKVLDLFKEEE